MNVVRFGGAIARIIAEEDIVGVGWDGNEIVHILHHIGEGVEHGTHNVGLIKCAVVFFLGILIDVMEFKIDFIFKKIDDEFVGAANQTTLEIAARSAAVKLDEDVFPVERFTGLYSIFERTALHAGRNIDTEKIAESGQYVDMADEVGH